MHRNDEYFTSTSQSPVSTQQTLLDVFKEINPWNNLRIMHTHIGRDIFAGIMVAIVALPLALAFGEGSGLGAITGVWGAVAGGIIGGLFGGCRVGVSGPTAPTMVLLALTMEGFHLTSGEPDLGAAFAIILLSGMILVLISLMGITRLIYFAPYPAVAGFMGGIGILIILQQFNSFVGAPSPHILMDTFRGIPYAIANASPQTLMVSIPTLAILILWSVITRRIPQIKGVPGPLTALTLGTGISCLGYFQIETLGKISTGLPHFYLPDWSRFGDFWIPAASLAVLAIFGSQLTCMAADHMTGGKHSSDRETFGQGLANMAAGLVGGLPGATAATGTVANVKSGGQTPLAAVVHGIALLLLVLGLTPLLEQIPMACLAAILIKVGMDILDYRILPVLHRLPFFDKLVFWAVLAITLWKGPLHAMGVGLVVAIFRFIQEVNQTYDHKTGYVKDVKRAAGWKALPPKTIKVLQPQGPLYFGSLKKLNETYETAKDHDVLIIKLNAVTMMDLSGVYGLENLMRRAQNEGREVVLSEVPDTISKVLNKLRVTDRLAEMQNFEVADEALHLASRLHLTGPETALSKTG